MVHRLLTEYKTAERSSTMLRRKRIKDAPSGAPLL
jgi:hypothetical protein